MRTVDSNELVAALEAEIDRLWADYDELEAENRSLRSLNASLTMALNLYKAESENEGEE